MSQIQMAQRFAARRKTSRSKPGRPIAKGGELPRWPSKISSRSAPIAGRARSIQWDPAWRMEWAGAPGHAFRTRFLL